MSNTLQTLADLGENIWRIVITGGPCSGKTTGLAVLESKLTERGYKVLVSPESATKLMNAGIRPGPKELEGGEFQRLILLDTIGQEDRICQAAMYYRDKGYKVVILCDRGTMDGEAYVDPREFGAMLTQFGYDRRSLCDERYHAVMHLRTAALGAPRFYTLENNATRTETPEQARNIDERTLAAWQRHPHPRVIDNSTDFEGKVRRLLAEVCTVLGDPLPFEREEKYLVDSSVSIVIPVRVSESIITQTYLVSSDPREEHRVRSRADNEGTTYYYTRKRYVAPGNRVEIERMITKEEHGALLAQKDPRSNTIMKRRVCFFWKDRYIEVDFFSEPHQHDGLVLMEIEHTGDTSQIELPPFLKVIRSVTDEKKYSNAELSRVGT
ncbi:MAG: AAA family ATPase [Patescibacteria group bacterium]